MRHGLKGPGENLTLRLLVDDFPRRQRLSPCLLPRPIHQVQPFSPNVSDRLQAPMVTRGSSSTPCAQRIARQRVARMNRDRRSDALTGAVHAFDEVVNLEHQPSSTADCSGADEVLEQARLSLLCEELGLEDTAEMAALFLEDLPKRCRACEVALTDGAIAVLQREAHSLKGSSSSFGLVELETIARDLELSAETNRIDRHSLELLITAADRARCALSAWLDRAKSALESS